jgi:outer membrane protein assembly factor BamB
MSPRTAVIDLDLLPAEPPPSDLPPVSRRRLWAAAVLVLAVLALAGGAPPRSDRAALVLTRPAVADATYEIIGDTFYAVEPSRDSSRITAYPLAGGSPRWSVTLDLLAGAVSLSALGDILVVASISGDPLETTHVTALDGRTGAVRWDNTLWPDRVDAARGVVLLDNPVRTDRIDAMPDGTVVAVAADTGQQRWAYRWNTGCQIDMAQPTPEDAGALAVLCGDGTLTAVDLATGRVRASVGGAFQLPAGYLDFGVSIVSLPGSILVSYPVTNGWNFVSFDPRDLTRRWTMTLPLDRNTVVSCHPRLCLSASSGTSVIDPTTGRVAWQLLPGVGISELTDRHLLAEDPSGRMSVLNADTGREALAVSGWTRVVTEDPPLLLRQDSAKGRTWVAGIDADPVGLRLVGWIPATVVGTDCTSTAGYLVCRTFNQVRVWRLPLPR